MWHLWPWVEEAGMAQSKTAQQQQHQSTTKPAANTNREQTMLTDSESDAALAALEAALIAADSTTITTADATHRPDSADQTDVGKITVPTHGTRRKITAIDDARAVLGGLDEWDPTLKDDMVHAVEEAMAAAAHGGHNDADSDEAGFEDDAEEDDEADLPPMTSLLPEDFDEYLDKDSTVAAVMQSGTAASTAQEAALSQGDAITDSETDCATSTVSKEVQDGAATNAKKHSLTKHKLKAKAKQRSTPVDSGDDTAYPYSMQQVDLFGNVDPFNGELLPESAPTPVAPAGVAPAGSAGSKAASYGTANPNGSSSATFHDNPHPSATTTPSPAAPQAPQEKGNSGYINPQSLGPVKRLVADTKYWLTPPVPRPEKTKVSAIVSPYLQGYAALRLPLEHPEPDAASVAHALNISLAIASARDQHDEQTVAQLQQEQYTVSFAIAQELGLLDPAPATSQAASSPARPEASDSSESASESAPAVPVVSYAVHLERLPLPAYQQCMQAYDMKATQAYAQVKAEAELRLEQAVKGLIYLGFTTMDCWVRVSDLPAYVTRESPPQYYPLWEQLQASHVQGKLRDALLEVQVKRASLILAATASTQVTATQHAQHAQHSQMAQSAPQRQASSAALTPRSAASLISLQGPLSYYDAPAAVASVIATASGITPLVPCAYEWQVEYTPYPQLDEKFCTDERGITLRYYYTPVTEQYLLPQLINELTACRQISKTIALFRQTQSSFNYFDARFDPLWMHCRYSGEILELLNDFVYDFTYYVPIADEVENPLIWRLHYDLPDVAEILGMLQEQQVNLFLLLAYGLSDNARRFVKSGKRPHKWQGGHDEFSTLLNLDDESKAQAARVCSQGLEQVTFWPGMSLPQLPPAYQEAANSLLFRFLSDPLYYEMWRGWVRLYALCCTPRGKELLQPFAHSPITDVYSPEWFVALNQLVGFPDGGLKEAVAGQEHKLEELETKIPYHHPLPGRSKKPQLRLTAEAEIQLDDERHRQAGLTRIPLLEPAHTVLAQSVVKQILPDPVRLKPLPPPPSESGA